MKLTTFMGGMALGLGLMYVLDPDQGRRRRSRLRDRAVRGSTQLGSVFRGSGRGLRSRARDVVAGARSRFTRTRHSDRSLIERIRRKLHHLVSHPDAIDLDVQQGRVTLRGPILANEISDLVSGLRSMPGVREVMNLLQAHAMPENITSLAGEESTTRSGRHVSRSSALQLLAGTVGVAVLAYGVSRMIAVNREESGTDPGSGAPEYVHSPLQEAHVF